MSRPKDPESALIVNHSALPKTAVWSHLDRHLAEAWLRRALSGAWFIFSFVSSSFSPAVCVCVSGRAATHNWLPHNSPEMTGAD